MSNNQIPSGLYCYRLISVKIAKTDFKMKIENCPFYIHINGMEGKCSMLGCEITDQVKDCGINEDLDKVVL